MKVIIAGSRTYTKDFWSNGRCCLIPHKDKITEIVSGTAQGADMFGENWAVENGVPVKRFPANWSTFGKAAGPIRNVQMADYADMLFLFWDGKSKGANHMLETMKKAQKPFVIFYFSPNIKKED